jgi:hypothetical protein
MELIETPIRIETPDLAALEKALRALCDRVPAAARGVTTARRDP